MHQRSAPETPEHRSVVMEITTRAKNAAGEEEDLPEGVFQGYLTLWDVVDSYDTYVARGAFKRTLKDKGTTRAMLYMHDGFTRMPVGILIGKEDEAGLLVRGEINLETTAGRDAYALVKQGAIKGLSQGFNIITAREDKQKNAVRIEEVEWWEGSLCVLHFNSVPGAEVEKIRAAARDAVVDELARAERARRIDTAIERLRKARAASA